MRERETKCQTKPFNSDILVDEAVDLSSRTSPSQSLLSYTPLVQAEYVLYLVDVILSVYSLELVN